MNGDPSFPPPPPAPLAPPVPRKGMSTGCIVGIVLAIVGAGLLVIVAAIAVFTSVAVKTSGKVLEKARAVQTRAAAAQIQIGLQAYKYEYGKFPPVGTPDEGLALESDGEFIPILTGEASTHNPRGISFYEPIDIMRAGSGESGTDTAGNKVARDSWGHYFRIHVDWNDDLNVPDPEHPGTVLPQTVLIYSAGPDGDYSTWSDNVKSWDP